MQLRDFQYDLPEALIAQYPLARRSDARLLTLDSRAGALADRRFTDLVQLLHPGDLLVCNDTRVIPARLRGSKASGGQVEVLVERILDQRSALVHLRASKSPPAGTRLHLEGGVQARVTGRQGEFFELEFDDTDAGGVLGLLEQAGHVPLPPYIRRSDEAQDRQCYQTVFAERPGAVAAPTAGLHFDAPMLDALARRGVRRTCVTLHVGAGTFQPVRTQDLASHHMHSERVEVSEAVCELVEQTRREGGRIVAVGTTVVRSLEAASASGSLQPMQGETRLFITPGYRFRSVDAMITNFHLPESTLLMLVAAFAGYEPVMAAYRHAVAQAYRFFSYGDAMFLAPGINGDT